MYHANIFITFLQKQICVLEIINGDKGHSYEVDWWSLGIIITELLVGYTPFQNSADEIPTEQELRSRILNQQPNMNEVRRITNFIPVVENFICSLLVKNPKKRLGKFQLSVLQN